MTIFNQRTNIPHRINRRVDPSIQLHFIPTSMGDVIKSFKKIVIPDKVREKIDNHVEFLHKKSLTPEQNSSHSPHKSFPSRFEELPDWDLYLKRIRLPDGYEQKYFPGITKDLLLLNKSFGKRKTFNVSNLEVKARFRDNSFGVMLYPFPIILKEFIGEVPYLFSETVYELINMYKSYVFNLNTDVSCISFNNFILSDEYHEFVKKCTFNRTISLYKSSVCFDLNSQIQQSQSAIIKYKKLLNHVLLNQKKDEHVRQSLFYKGCISVYSRQMACYMKLCASDRKLADVFQVGVPISDLNSRGILEYTSDIRSDMKSKGYLQNEELTISLNTLHSDLLRQEQTESNSKNKKIGPSDHILKKHLSKRTPLNYFLYLTNQPGNTRREQYKVLMTNKKRKVHNLSIINKETTIFTFYLHDLLLSCNTIYEWFGLNYLDFYHAEIQLKKLQIFLDDHKLSDFADIISKLPTLKEELNLNDKMYENIFRSVSKRGLQGIDSNIVLYNFYTSVENRLSTKWIRKSQLIQLEKIIKGLLDKYLQENSAAPQLLLKLVNAKLSLLSFIREFGEKANFFLVGEQDSYLIPSLSLDDFSSQNKAYNEWPTFELPWSKLQNRALIQEILSELKVDQIEFVKQMGMKMSCLEESGNSFHLSLENPFGMEFTNIYKLCNNLFNKYDLLSQQVQFISELSNFYNLIGLPYNVWLDNEKDSLVPEYSDIITLTSENKKTFEMLVSKDSSYNSIIKPLELSLHDAHLSITSLCLINKEESYSGLMFSYFYDWISNITYYLLSNSYTGIPNKAQKFQLRFLKSYVDRVTFNSHQNYVHWKTKYFTKEWQKLSSEYWTSFSGKTGRFRATILSKRSNFTGRAVIASGPELQLSQCVIPCKIALVLFLPTYVARMKSYFNKIFWILQSDSCFSHLGIEYPHIKTDISDKVYIIQLLYHILKKGAQVIRDLMEGNVVDFCENDLFFRYIEKDPLYPKYLPTVSRHSLNLCEKKELKEAIILYIRNRFCNYMQEHLWGIKRCTEEFKNSSQNNSNHNMNSNLIASLHYYSGFILYFNRLMEKHSVLLIRQPALHRMSLQSFVCQLGYEAKTIRLNTLVCPPFNADFDGDTMSVYLPHSIDSQIEANMILASFNNIVSPSTSSIIIAPTLDTLFGLYYLTSIGQEYYNCDPIHMNSSSDYVHFEKDFHFNKYPVNYPVILKGVPTTLGRVFIYYLISQKCNLNFQLLNKTLKKKTISTLISEIILHHSIKVASFILDMLNIVGKEWSYRSGLTVNYFDFIVPDIKNKISKKYFIDQHKNEFFVEKKFMQYRQTVHLSESYKTKMVEKVIDNLGEDIVYVPSNGNVERPGVYMLIDSGSRGSINQLKQICGVKGFVRGATGEIVPKPIMGNLKEGFSQEEFFLSSIGGRKGMIDRSLNTQVTGYLHRLLNSSLKTLTITGFDCHTYQGISVGLFENELKDSYFRIKDNRFNHLVGRVLASNVYSPLTGNLLLGRNEILTKKDLLILLDEHVSDVLIRSPLTCGLERGICQRCYGANLSIVSHSISLVQQGYPIGVIAAQAMGEPSTQLSMRTFHQGGIVDTIANEQQSINVNYTSYSGFICVHNMEIIREHAKPVSLFTYGGLSKNNYSTLLVIGIYGEILESIPVPLGAFICVQDGDYVLRNTVVYETHFPINSHSVQLYSHYPMLITHIYHAQSKELYPFGGIIEYITYCQSADKSMYLHKDFFTFFRKDHLYVKSGDCLPEGALIVQGFHTDSRKLNSTESYRIIKRILDAPKSLYSFPIAYFDGYVSMSPLDVDHIHLSLTSDEIKIDIKTILEWLVSFKILGIKIHSSEFDFKNLTCILSPENETLEKIITIILQKSYIIPSKDIDLLKVRDGSFVEEGFIMKDLKDCVHIRDLVFFLGIDGAWKMIGENILHIYHSAGITFEPIYMELLVKQMIQFHCVYHSTTQEISLESRHQMIIKLIHRLCFSKTSFIDFVTSEDELQIPKNFLPHLYHSFQTLLSLKQIPFQDVSFFGKISFERMAATFLQAFKDRDHFQGQRSMYDIDTNLFMTIPPAYGTTLRKRLKSFNDFFIRK